MGYCDLVGFGWLSSGFQDSSQLCTLQQEGEGSGVFPEHRMIQKRIRHYPWDAGECFCCAVRVLLVSSNVTLLLRTISNIFSRERIFNKAIGIVSLTSPAVAWSHSKHTCGRLS